MNAIKFRQAVERRIARRFVRDAIAAGHEISVNDSEEVTVERSRDARKVVGALMTTDDDYLILTKDGKNAGWVHLVYGNDGWDVISNYTTNLEPLMAGAAKLAEKLETMYA